MKLKDFTDYLNSVRPGSDYTAEVWYEWAKDLERMDSSKYELPKGEYKTAEMFLDEFVEKFRFIREKYGDKVTGQVISLADVPACPFPWEMRLAAVHFAKGGSIEDIPRDGGRRHVGGIQGHGGRRSGGTIGNALMK